MAGGSSHRYGRAYESRSRTGHISTATPGNRDRWSDYWLHPARSIIIDSHTQSDEATEFVVVETDASHCDYDAGLRSLLAEHEQALGQRLPFPRTARITAATLARDYRQAHVAAGPDRSWHFRVQVPHAAELELPATRTDDPGQPVRLATIRLRPAQSYIDVLGVPEPDAQNVADWLDEWLELTGMRPFSSRPRRAGQTLMGDVLATGHQNDALLVARYTSVRCNERTFVLVLRTPLDDYRDVAHDFVLAASSLAPPYG